MTQECLLVGHGSTPATRADLLPPSLVNGTEREVSLISDLQTPSERRLLIEQAVSQVFGVAQRELHSFSRGRARVASARQVAMYLAHVTCGLNLSDTGRLFERDRTTVAHACALVEDRRDDAVYDRIMELLEGVVSALLKPRNDTVYRN